MDNSAAVDDGARPDRDARSVVAVGGLARTDAGSFGMEFASVVEQPRDPSPVRKALAVPVNAGLATLSDHMFTWSIILYSLALVAYCGEYAFGRRGKVASTSPVRAFSGSPFAAWAMARAA